MNPKVNYFIVGLFVIILGSALVFGVLWLSNGSKHKQYDKYLVITKESVAGLSPNSSVKFNGVSVGQVKSIKINPMNPQQVRILLNIEKETPINQSTVATLKMQGITGVAYMGLEATSATAPPLVKPENEPYPVIPSRPSLLVELDTMLRKVTMNLDNLTKSVRKTFSKENQAALTRTLRNTDAFTQMLVDNTRTIRRSMNSLDVLLANTSKASKQLPSAVKHLNSTLNQIDKAAKSFKKTGDTLNLTAKETQVTFANFNQQTFPSILELVEQMKGLSTNLDQFVTGLKQNPSELIRGRAPSSPGPGE